MEAKQEYLAKIAAFRFGAEGRFSGEGIPENTRWAIADYVIDGHRPGSFLCAVLSNDLKRSFERADRTNTRAVGAIVAFLYNHAPEACWGSEGRLEAWIEYKYRERTGTVAYMKGSTI